MKKFIVLSAAAASFAGAGVALADPIDCSARSAQCHTDGAGHVYQYDSRGRAVTETQPHVQRGHGYGYGYNYGLPYVLADRGYVVVPQYRGNSRDRDGDGVRNSRDRYPNNPHYR